VVNTLCVAEEHRGRGLGAEIMRQFMAEAAAAGVSIDVFVLKANPRARALYQRLGFVDAEQLDHHFRMAWPVAS
jgi:ribosomal protein S18 acetylase RimI-like enzyme